MRKNKTNPIATQETGSLVISGKNKSDGVCFISSKNVVSAKISISGCDIDPETEASLSLENVKIKNGKITSPIHMENIPAGKNRIISVIPYDKDGKELSPQTVRAVTDIEAGKENLVTVNSSTIIYATVLYGIKEVYNFDLLEKEGSLKKIRDITNIHVHPSLFDSAKFIGELKGFQIPVSADSSPYILKPGSVTFDYVIENNFTVSVNDPLSDEQKNLKASKNITIENIAPGNWTLSITDKKGNLIDSRELQIKSGENQNIGHLIPDGIVVLAETNLRKSICTNFNHLHYWDISYPEEIPSSRHLKNTKWPGIRMRDTVSFFNFKDEKGHTTHTKLSSFYIYKFAKAKSVNLLLTNTSETKFCEHDINISAQGLYLIQSEGAVPLTKQEVLTPVNIDHLDIQKEHLQKCFIDDPKNNRFIVLFSKSLFRGKITSVKACFNRGINDAEPTSEYNGKHYQMIKNEKGFWYCAVPYEDVQQTNQSGQPSYNFKVNNTMIEPPASVPDGYIYQKFTGSSGKNRYLVLIYSEDSPYFTYPEKTITENISSAKKAKTLKDFDLTSREGKMQISNFRLVAGTKTLYRSYHPIKDDKTAISDTSEARMKCLEELSKEAGINFDINLADDTLKTATYYVPAYYKKLISSNKIYYMTKCGYDICYSQSDKKAFAEGIKNLLEKIAETEGPYQFHCAIGTDRTGICGAVIGGLCGAEWNQIQDDYYSSIQMGIFEYRGPGCVRYSMQNFLQEKNISEVKNLQEKIIAVLKERTDIKDSTIRDAIKNLGGIIPL